MFPLWHYMTTDGFIYLSYRLPKLIVHTHFWIWHQSGMWSQENTLLYRCCKGIRHLVYSSSVTKHGAWYLNWGCMPESQHVCYICLSTGVQNSTAAKIYVIVNRSDQEVSHHSPSRLQAEHFGVQKTARLQGEETHNVKEVIQGKHAQIDTKQTAAK